MSDDPEIENIRQDAWDKALFSFGYSFLYQRRYRIYRRWLRLLLFVGLGVPMLVGALAMAFGVEKWVIVVASIVGIVQLMLNLFAVVQKLDDEVVYSQKAASEHSFLSDAFKQLGQNPASSKTKVRHEYELLQTRLASIDSTDKEHGLTPKELRRAHRAGHREFRRECVACNTTPTDMKSVDCGVCGRFGFFNKQHT
jgi:mobilome CxxCx(11)CxxC protein